jgi:hypothetical protein
MWKSDAGMFTSLNIGNNAMSSSLYNYGQGAVRNLETDRRLKRNRPPRTELRSDAKRGGQGQVKDPDQDRRLKKNRPAADAVS